MWSWGNKSVEAVVEYAASTKITATLVERIQSQKYELSDDSRIQALKQIARKEKNDAINDVIG